MLRQLPREPCSWGPLGSGLKGGLRYKQVRVKLDGVEDSHMGNLVKIFQAGLRAFEIWVRYNDPDDSVP